MSIFSKGAYVTFMCCPRYNTEGCEKSHYFSVLSLIYAFVHSHIFLKVQVLHNRLWEQKEWITKYLTEERERSVEEAILDLDFTGCIEDC